MTIINHPSTVLTSDLPEKPLGPPSAIVLSDGPISVHSRVDFATEDRRTVSGIWESAPGTSRWEFTGRGEIIHVLSGAMNVQEDGAAEEHIAAGDTAYFPIGWCGTWTVTETLRKVYVVFKP